jgi:hypothetical protein
MQEVFLTKMEYWGFMQETCFAEWKGLLARRMLPIAIGMAAGFPDEEISQGYDREFRRFHIRFIFTFSSFYFNGKSSRGRNGMPSGRTRRAV